MIDGCQEPSRRGLALAAAGGHPRRVLLSDEGDGRVLLVDLADPAHAAWSTQLDHSPGPAAQGRRSGRGSTARGQVEPDLAGGEIRKQVGGFSGVETLRRLADGHTVLGGTSNGGATLQGWTAPTRRSPGAR